MNNLLYEFIIMFYRIYLFFSQIHCSLPILIANNKGQNSSQESNRSIFPKEVIAIGVLSTHQVGNNETYYNEYPGSYNVRKSRYFIENASI